MSSSSPTGSTFPSSPTPSPTLIPNPAPTPNLPITWQYNGSEWRSLGTAPSCPGPFTLRTPVDLSKATSILYPGQIRGGDYKAHGGFRFDNSTDGSIIVRAPYDAVIVDASRYIERNEVQYMFSFQVSCGIQYRFDHLKTLSSALQAVADTLPEPKVDDTRTTFINPPVSVLANEVLATKVGMTGNASLDWGVYDLRQKNTTSHDPSWAAAHASNSLASHAICWFDWLSSGDAITVRSLPGTGTNGTTSDYCK